MKERIILLIASLLPVILFSQDPPPSFRISLKEAREIAFRNNPDLKIKELDIRIASAQADQSKWRRIPQIYGDFNLQRNLIIPVTPVPANAFRPDAPEGELIPLRFTTKWTSNTGLNADINLFNPQKRSELAEARIQTEIKKIDKEAEENDLLFNLDEAYAAAVIATEQVSLAVSDTITNHDVWKMSREQFTAGRLSQSNLNQVRADLNSSRNNFAEAQKILLQAKAELLLIMGYNPAEHTSVELSDDVESLFVAFQNNSNIDSGSIALKKLREEDRLLHTQLQSAKAGYLPTISIKGYYGASYFDNNMEIFKGNNWYGNSFMSLGVRLPITESIERSKKITEIRLQTEVNRLAFNSQHNKNQLEILQAKRDISFLENKYLLSKENYKLAVDNYRIAKEQYDSGRLLIADLSRASYAYQLEKNNYLNVAYDYIIAKMKLGRANRN